MPGVLPQRYKMFVFLLSLVFFAWLFADLVMIPARERIAQQKVQLQAERNWVKAVQDFSMAHPEPVKYLNYLDNKLAALEVLFPLDARLSEFLTQAESAAKAAGVQLLSLKPGPSTNRNGFRDWTIDLVVRGSFFETMNFIKKLEAGPRFNTVSSFTIKSMPGYLESKLSISIFSFGAAKIASKNDSG